MNTKVLAIDDSRTIRDLLRVTLESAGFEYHSADDGREGVEVFPVVDPDVVITDINMPRLDGYGVIEELRADQKTKIPIIVLTTESSAEQKARARGAGATGWIVKPFDDVSLISVLKRLTGHVV